MSCLDKIWQNICWFGPPGWYSKKFLRQSCYEYLSKGALASEINSTRDDLFCVKAPYKNINRKKFLRIAARFLEGAKFGWKIKKIVKSAAFSPLWYDTQKTHFLSWKSCSNWQMFRFQGDTTSFGWKSIGQMSRLKVNCSHPFT